MKVIVPHVEFRPDLCRLLEDEGINPRFVSTHEHDGYWECLSDAWAEGDTFIVLEGDKYPAPGALLELWECLRLWCVYPVPMRDTDAVSPYPSLACVKFDEDMITADPLLMDRVGEINVGFGEREWSRLDMAVAAFAGNITDAHYHDAGRVEHRH